MLEKMNNLKESDLGFAKVDIERLDRCGHPEVIFSEYKTPDDVAQIAARIRAAGQPLLATRANADHAEATLRMLPNAEYRPRARCILEGRIERTTTRKIGLVCAGTSDLPVVEEAAATLDVFGWPHEIICDVGVAGIHRLMSRAEAIKSFDVLIVVAGMEGALPSVVAGLTRHPVIAVPTSVGYGVGANGIAALMGMLTSCASGLTVVNIDNGFGAACAADAILSLF